MAKYDNPARNPDAEVEQANKDHKADKERSGKQKTEKTIQANRGTEARLEKELTVTNVSQDEMVEAIGATKGKGMVDREDEAGCPWQRWILTRICLMSCPGGPRLQAYSAGRRTGFSKSA
ncbi:unnamed protein product [Symbiodinium sp. CCMP2592]|nr:unnamed protein product [Symbiodinium sp. CCMP2592]